MARREYRFSPVCGYDGCGKRAYYVYDTRREQAESMARLRRDGWLCSRHARPNEVLSVENPVVEDVLVSYETDYRFWAGPEKGAERKGGNGFVYGHGFKAWAEDFPTGTRLVITARVELPPESSQEIAHPAHTDRLDAQQ
jgi:hypothetical protein